MQFSSYIFILTFLPITLILFHLLEKRWKTAGKILLILAGLLFCAYDEPKALLVICADILVNLIFVLAIRKAGKGRKILFAAGILINIAFLAVRGHFPAPGISFLTFSQIMVLTGVYRDDLKDIGITDQLSYILYFPKILMGPLMEPSDFTTQLHDPEKRRLTPERAAEGIKLFSFGFFKKIVLADALSSAVLWGFSNTDTATSADLFLVMLCYTFQIYFDFSGYCDMGMGISALFGFELPVNFNSPYRALSIRDFWKRWHISLTTFFTKYLYFPLGGNRKGKLRTYLNVMIVFLLSGLWHGFGWTFLLWGALHGLFSVLDRVFENAQKKLSEAIRFLCTFFTVNVLWLLFRAESVGQWLRMLKTMFLFQDTKVSEGLLDVFLFPERNLFYDLFRLHGLSETVRGFEALIFLVFCAVVIFIPENTVVRKKTRPALIMVLSAAAFVYAFLCLGSESVFIYQGF